MGLFNKEPAPSERDMDKADFHIARYDRAIAQCTKPERLAGLKRERKYWTALKTAAALRPE